MLAMITTTEVSTVRGEPRVNADEPLADQNGGSRAG
jgi:hypothetical protein